MAWWQNREMPSLEERVAYLEGRTEEHAGTVGTVQNDIRELRTEMVRRFEQMDSQLNHMDVRFNWLVGLQFATLLAVISVGSSRRTFISGLK